LALVAGSIGVDWFYTADAALMSLLQSCIRHQSRLVGEHLRRLPKDDAILEAMSE